jgi:hypothetical protein
VPENLHTRLEAAAFHRRRDSQGLPIFGDGTPRNVHAIGRQQGNDAIVGKNIARRTVAKYREALRIPSSVERRRLKAGEVLAR